MELPNDRDRHTRIGTEPYSSLEPVNGVPDTANEPSGLIFVESKQEYVYPQAVYEINREAPEAVNLEREHQQPPKKSRISKRWVWLAVILFLIIAAVGGGVGGSLAGKHSKTVSQTAPSAGPSTTATSSSPSASQTAKIQAQTGTSISSINWGAGPSYQMKVYFQGNDSFIYESSFAAGNWTSPKKLVQAKPLTPITSMFFPSDGSGNVSITICYLSDQNIVTEYVYDGQKWDQGHLGVSIQYQALNSSKLAGTLLRQPQPNNGSHVWEPYVLYYQQTDYNFRELVQTPQGWTESIYFGVTAYKGSPVAVAAGDNGYSLQLFYLRANDTQLLGFNATRDTLNASSYNNEIFVRDDYISRAWPTRGNYYADGRFGTPWTNYLHSTSNCSALSIARLDRQIALTTNDITTFTPSWLQCMHEDSNNVDVYVYDWDASYSYTQMIWDGPAENIMGFGGRGLAALPRSSIASFYDSGTNAWPCRRGYIFQNVQGSLDAWGSSCIVGAIWDANGTLPSI